MLDAVLKSLSDPTRRQILDRLSLKGELPVHALTSAGGISQPAVSKHLARLKQAQLVTTRNVGRETFYGTNASGLAVLLDWLRQQGALKMPPRKKGVAADRISSATEEPSG